MASKDTRILIASQNHHKIEEIQHIFHDMPIPVLSYARFFLTIHFSENGRTFSENAVKKVTPFPLDPRSIFLADDSGLVIEALEGAPGIYSARYTPEGTSLSLCQKVLADMHGKKNRSAYFQCVIALKFPDESIQLAEGKVEGTIATEMRGTHGFGYDPIFIPKGWTTTFAESTLNEKNKISHRYRALMKAKEQIKTYLKI